MCGTLATSAVSTCDDDCGRASPFQPVPNSRGTLRAQTLHDCGWHGFDLGFRVGEPSFGHLANRLDGLDGAITRALKFNRARPGLNELCRRWTLWVDPGANVVPPPCRIRHDAEHEHGDASGEQPVSVRTKKGEANDSAHDARECPSQGGDEGTYGRHKVSLPAVEEYVFWFVTAAQAAMRVLRRTTLARPRTDVRGLAVMF